MIATSVSEHAARQARRRGISHNTVSLVLNHSDRSQKLAGSSRAVWLSKRKRAALAYKGLAPADVARTRGVRLIISIPDDVVLTVEHTQARRHWA